ncbi:MAG TPA: PD-(D/E)XK nuclease family protein [Candidatus Paceibacterota bacterium]|nr:PD-(D/E)XK nuclease family protein [Candidatus Paceibacterota bacterium]
MAQRELPIQYWSHSSLMAYLRNPLAWYKRYVELVYDTPSSPSGIVGRAAHAAVEHYYSGMPPQAAIELGLESLRNVSDFEINFGKAATRKAKKKKRASMEREYLQAANFYLAKPPRFKVVGVEVKGMAPVPGLELQVKAVSDLVVKSAVAPGSLDIVDHKFVDTFSAYKAQKTIFIIQAIFNYYTVREKFRKPVRRFIIIECKKTKNKDGKPQLRRYTIDFEKQRGEFALFKRLLRDATEHLKNTPVFLPNPSDLFEGENSFDIYRLGLAEEEGEEE